MRRITPEDDVPDPPPSSRRASSLVGAGILLSRISGVVRERAIAHFLGAGGAVDAFRAALRIPNVLQNLLGEGALSASFIPVYSRLLAEGKDEEAKKVAGAVAGMLAAVAGIVVLLGVTLARPITVVLAPGFHGERFELTVRLVRILTPGIGILVLSAWCLGVLNSHRRFFLSYVAPVLWNGAQIAVLVAVGLRATGEESLAVALAWGTFAGGVLQFLVQLPGVIRVAPGIRPSLRARLPGVRRVVRTFLPNVAGRGIVQLSAYLDLLLASLLAVGAVAALGFAQALYVLPVSLFGMSVAAAELPELSSLPEGEGGQAIGRLHAGLARIAFFVTLTSVVYLVVGDMVVGALFQTGDFGALQTRLVWFVLAGYTVGLLASTSSRLLQSALFAAGNTRTPALIAGARVLVSTAIGVAIMFQLDRLAVVPGAVHQLGSLPAFGPLPVAVREAGDTVRLGALGLSLASGLAAWLEFTLLRRAVATRVGRVSIGGGHARRILASGAVAALAGLAVRWLVDDLHPLVAGAIAGIVVAGAYLAAATALGVPEARTLTSRFRRRATTEGTPPSDR